MDTLLLWKVTFFLLKLEKRPYSWKCKSHDPYLKRLCEYKVREISVLFQRTISRDMIITKIKALRFLSGTSTLCEHFQLYFPATSPLTSLFKLTLRHYVTNTGTFVCSQNSLPFTLAGLSTFSTPHPLIFFSPLSLYSSLSPLSWLFPDRPRANVHQMPPNPPPPLSPKSHPIPQPVTAHSSVRYRHMELLSVPASLSLSQPLSPTLRAVYFVFLFLIPDQVKNK